MASADMIDAPVQFTVHGKPAPGGSKRGFMNPKTKRIIITDASKGSRPWKAQVADAAAAAMEGRELLDGPLVVHVTFVLARPAGHFGKNGLRTSAPHFPTVRPDVGKLVRPAFDAMTGIVWRDDSQVVTEVASKVYGEPTCMVVRVKSALAVLTERVLESAL